MIKKSIFEDELIHGMEKELSFLTSSKKVDNLERAIDYLHSAAAIFKSIGMEKRSDRIFDLIIKIAKTYDSKKKVDRHTKGLTSEKMVENLKHHGIVFNLADDGNDGNNIDDVDSFEVFDDQDADFEDEL